MALNQASLLLCNVIRVGFTVPFLVLESWIRRSMESALTLSAGVVVGAPNDGHRYSEVVEALKKVNIRLADCILYPSKFGQTIHFFTLKCCKHSGLLAFAGN